MKVKIQYRRDDDYSSHISILFEGGQQEIVAKLSNPPQGYSTGKVFEHNDYPISMEERRKVAEAAENAGWAYQAAASF